MSPTSEHHAPDCPVCGASVPPIPRNGDQTVSKRTCPRCRRRFRFTITWLPDRRCAVASERIGDYDRRPMPRLSGREFTLIRLALVNTRADARDNPDLEREFVALLTKFPDATPKGA